MPIGDSDLAATKQDLIAAIVQRELIAAATVMRTVRDVSSFAVKGSKTISFPKAGSFTVEDRATTVEANKANITYATDTLTPDRMATVSWLVDPQDDIESTVNTEADTAGRAAKALGKDVDTQLIAGLETDSTVTTTAGAITKDIILEMRESLLTAEADPAQLWLAIGPTSESTLLAISEFVEPDRYGSARIPSGQLGTLYGVKVVLSTQIAALTFYMYDSEGYAVGFQKGASMDERKAPEFGTGAILRTMDQKFGVAELQGGLLLRKDNNV